MIRRPMPSRPTHASPGGDSRFRELFSAIDEGYCLCEMVVDESGQAIDYRFLEINPQFSEMTGLVDAEGRTARELVPGLEQAWVDTYAKVGLGRETTRFQQGSEVMGRWFDVFAMPIGPMGMFAIVFKDDTQRQQALRDLQASEERFRRLAEQERAASLRLQRALLPDGLVEDPFVEAAAFYAAGTEGLQVGGDWYDSFAWPDGRVGVMVGDVVGHGIESAAAMGRLRAAVSALAPYTGGSAAAMVSALSTCAQGPNGCDYLTAACAVIDPLTHTLRYARAGHPAPVLIHPDGRVDLLEDGLTPPLGVVMGTASETVMRPEGQMTITPGATVVMFSDGLVERRGEDIVDGLNRLADVARNYAGVDPDSVCKGLARDLVGAAVPDDDVVVVALHLRKDAPAAQ